MGEIYWLESGDLLVPYLTLDPDRNFDRTGHLLVLRPAHGPSFEVRDAPRLLAVLPGDTLCFADPAGEAPDRWRLGRWVR